MPNIPYKNITSLISSKQENATFTTVNNGIDSGVTFTLCDRDVDSNPTKEANYFMSFRLPYAEDNFPTGSTLSIQNPELQQLNVDKMVISPIPYSDYHEIIDGRSVTITVPQLSGTTYTLVSSTYGTLTKGQNSIMLGNNIAFLFCDDINLPRTGTTNGGMASVTSFAPRNTWNRTPFVNRPAAHSYSNLSAVDINTDQRSWSGVNLAVTSISENYPTNTNQGYNYDIPVGFVALDKGFVVITHPDIVNNIPWDQGFQLHTNAVNTGSTSATTSIYFDNSVSQITFSDIDINFRTSIVCLALPTEFTFSTNPSWDLSYNLQELSTGTNGFTPIQVTEIGLYNKKNELIAVAKLDRPVEKNYTNLITFNLDIDV